MKKPSEMTVGLVAAVFAVGAAMWIDEANAGDKSANADSQVEVQKKKKPRAKDVASGTAAEPSKPLDENVSETAKDADSDFREGYGGSGASTAEDDGRTDTKDVGRGVRKAEESTKEMGRELKKDAKAADRGVRAGYHDERTDAPRATQDTADGRTDASDLGYELGKGARRIEEAAAEAARKIRGETEEFNRGYEEGYGGSGDAGTATTTGMDGGTATKGKLEVKLKTGAGKADGGTK